MSKLHRAGFIRSLGTALHHPAVMRALPIAAVLAGALFLAVPFAGAAEPSDPDLPFKPGESVIYDVSWMGVVGGEARLSVAKQISYKGARVYTLESTGRSVGFLRKLYNVEDHTISYFDIDNLYSRRVEIRISEGDYHKVKIIEFDHEKLTATYKINERAPEEFEIDPGSQDSFSSLYALRSMREKLKPGAKVFIPLFEDKKKYQLEIKVVRKERLKLGPGMIDTIVIKPLLKTEGIFQRRGKMTIWLSDDKNLVPVMVSSKIVIGSFYATIKSYKGVDLNFIPYPKPPPPPARAQTK